MRLSLRLGLIIIVALTLVFGLLVLAFLAQQRPGRVYGVTLPLPRQVAAMTEMIEGLPMERWPLATAALSTPATRVEILDEPPAGRGGRAMQGLMVGQRAYAAAVKGRPVTMMAKLDTPEQSPDIELGTDAARATRPVRILVGLHNGKTLMIEARGPAAARFTGLRLGVLALMLTLLIGAVTLWFMRRQLKPLERLGVAVEKFGTRLEPSALAEEGSLELRQLIAAFNRLQANIGDLVRGRTRIITAVGHDIGTYLTRLRLRAEYIGDEDQRARAIRDIEDMQSLMRETLALAKLEADGDGAAPVDIVPLLQKCADGFGAAADVPDGPVMVRVGPASFERAIGNLVANAIKYGSEACVMLTAGAAQAEILVQDRGPGIPACERAQVLEPFYRGDEARNLNQRGFGLGLAIVNEVVKTARGTLALEDRDGGGLTVRVTLPLA
jgi:signal transduction histidine kinase